jgi:tetratricopeptide (TPR) repeat protein
LILSGLAFLLAACGSSPASPSPTSAADKLVNSGLAAQEAGRTAVAVQDYEQAVKDDPLQLYAYYDLGVVYQQLGDVSASANDYQKALLIDPTYKSALYNLAILETPGSPSVAVTDYKRLLTFDRNDPNVLFKLGTVENRLGDTAAGTQDLNEAVHLDPSLASSLPTTTTTTTAASK